MRIYKLLIAFVLSALLVIWDAFSLSPRYVAFAGFDSATAFCTHFPEDCVREMGAKDLVKQAQPVDVVDAVVVDEYPAQYKAPPKGSPPGTPQVRRRTGGRISGQNWAKPRGSATKILTGLGVLGDIASIATLVLTAAGANSLAKIAEAEYCASDEPNKDEVCLDAGAIYDMYYDIQFPGGSPTVGQVYAGNTCFTPPFNLLNPGSQYPTVTDAKGKNVRVADYAFRINRALVIRSCGDRLQWKDWPSNHRSIAVDNYLPVTTIVNNFTSDSIVNIDLSSDPDGPVKIDIDGDGVVDEEVSNGREVFVYAPHQYIVTFNFNLDAPNFSPGGDGLPRPDYFHPDPVVAPDGGDGGDGGDGTSFDMPGSDDSIPPVVSDDELVSDDGSPPNDGDGDATNGLGGSSCIECTSEYRTENFLYYFGDNLETKFPFDAFGNIPSGSSSACPRVIFFNREKEICFVNDIFGYAKYPVWAAFLIRLILAL